MLARDLLHQDIRRLPTDVQRTVVERAAVALGTGVAVARAKKQEVARSEGPFSFLLIRAS